MRSLSCEREGRLSTSGTEGREGGGRTASPAARGPASRFPVPACEEQSIAQQVQGKYKSLEHLVVSGRKDSEEYGHKGY